MTQGFGGLNYLGGGACADCMLQWVIQSAALLMLAAFYNRQFNNKELYFTMRLICLFFREPL